MSFEQFLQISNVLVIPALGYIIMLERRITKMQLQIEMLLEEIRGHHA